MSSWENSLITFLASFWLWLMYAFLILLMVFKKGFSLSQLLNCLLASFIAWGLAQMIKDLFPQTLRPFQINGLPPLTLTIPLDTAFPSGHSAAAFGLGVAVLLSNKRLGIFYVLGAVFVSLGRVLGNVHYPIDVFGGAVLGAFTALALEKISLAHLLKKRRR